MSDYAVNDFAAIAANMNKAEPLIAHITTDPLERAAEHLVILSRSLLDEHYKAIGPCITYAKFRDNHEAIFAAAREAIVKALRDFCPCEISGRELDIRLPTAEGDTAHRRMRAAAHERLAKLMVGNSNT